MTTQELLQEVDNAINTVLVGGQSYKIGSRQLTRADLSELRTLKKELQVQVNEEPCELFGNTFVSVFDGR
ncbi:putative uncharacterized protein [Clostridium sp. CAG:411]|mgnify:FL=1|jgi:hypothetical protein|nr:putative uncharacterized protein [Clostridium sp. CAG:411]DAW23654.1 MAG TPA: head to tail adaptor [Caudoviricetes sp.]